MLCYVLCGVVWYAVVWWCDVVGRYRRFREKGKLNSRYVELFEILEKVGKIAYRLALLPSLEEIHQVLDVSQLRLYVSDPGHVLNYGE